MKSKGERKKLLILTSATGAGHDTHARAATEWCLRLYGEDVVVRIEHVLEDSHWVFRAGVDFYNFIQRKAPWVHHFYYHLLEFLDFLNFGTVTLGREYYSRLLQDFRPDAVLSVHDCLNRGYFELAQKILGPDVSCATYCPEFSGGYGFSKNWVNPRGDYFFGRTEETIQKSSARHLGGGRALVSGHWAPPGFYKTAMEAEEKAEYLGRELGLEKNRFTLLLSTGGAGAQNHQALLRALEELSPDLQVIALCGRDEKTRADLEDWVRGHSQLVVRALGFRSDMSSLLQVSSAVVARAGATTAGEALLCGCPVIFNAIGGLMPQEIPTWNYFQKRGIGARIFRPSALTGIVDGWIRSPASYKALKSRLMKESDTSTPEKALRLLLDQCQAQKETRSESG